MWQWIGKVAKHVVRGGLVSLAIMIALAFAPDPVGKWGKNFWISVDQMGNTVLFGDPDETISSRLGKWITFDDVDAFRRMWGHTVCFFLDWVDSDHCENSIDHEEGKDAILAGIEPGPIDAVD